MHNEHEHKDLLENLGYETHDVDYKKFSVYAGYFFGFFVACIILGFVFVDLMSPTHLYGGKMADYKSKVDMPLSTPLLQSNITARTDIMSLRRNEAAEMDSAAVIDQAHGVYRVPIDQAIDDVVNMSDAQKSSMGLPPTSSMAQIPGTSVPSVGSGHVKDFKDNALAEGTDHVKTPSGSGGSGG